MDELFPLCAKKNIGIMLSGTYNSGILASNLSVGAKFNYAEAPADVLERARGLQAVAARHQVSLKAAALQFAMAHPQVTCIIPGTRVPDRVRENLTLVDEPIPSTFWAELKAENLIRQDAPVPKSVVQIGCAASQSYLTVPPCEAHKGEIERGFSLRPPAAEKRGVPLPKGDKQLHSEEPGLLDDR
jgi:predicted aldo/keto reductase-like oxidoreductase